MVFILYKLFRDVGAVSVPVSKANATLKPLNCAETII
jgi:hypothetical protein